MGDLQGSPQARVEVVFCRRRRAGDAARVFATVVGVRVVDLSTPSSLAHRPLLDQHRLPLSRRSPYTSLHGRRAPDHGRRGRRAAALGLLEAGRQLRHRWVPSGRRGRTTSSCSFLFLDLFQQQQPAAQPAAAAAVPAPEGAAGLLAAGRGRGRGRGGSRGKRCKRSNDSSSSSESTRRRGLLSRQRLLVSLSLIAGPLQRRVDGLQPRAPGFDHRAGFDRGPGRGEAAALGGKGRGRQGVAVDFFFRFFFFHFFSFLLPGTEFLQL